MKTSTLPSYRSAVFSEAEQNSEFGDLCLAAAAERELAQVRPPSASDWEFIRLVQRSFNARLEWPKCAARGCGQRGFWAHGRRLCLPHWRLVYRLAFAQRLDARGIAYWFVRMYGSKVPPPRT
jgi:hypothetical protein